MDREGIQEIKESVVASEFNDLAVQSIGAVALPDNYSLIDLEPYLDYRRQDAMRFGTSSMKHFSKYVEQRGSERPGSICAIDPEDVSAMAYFDVGTKENPGHCRDKAVLKMTPTAEYDAVMKTDGARFSQREFSDWLEDWATEISLSDGQGDLVFREALAAVRELTVEAARSVESKVGDFSDSMTAMEKIEAKGVKRLPSRVRFTFTPYAGFDPFMVEMRVRVLTSGDRPTFSVSCISMPSIKESISEEFRAMLSDSIPSCRIVVGRLYPA